MIWVTRLQYNNLPKLSGGKVRASPLWIRHQPRDPRSRVGSVADTGDPDYLPKRRRSPLLGFLIIHHFVLHIDHAPAVHRNCNGSDNGDNPEDPGQCADLAAGRFASAAKSSC